VTGQLIFRSSCLRVRSGDTDHYFFTYRFFRLIGCQEYLVLVERYDAWQIEMGLQPTAYAAGHNGTDKAKQCFEHP
jgi:hypothetical protein